MDIPQLLYDVPCSITFKNGVRIFENISAFKLTAQILDKNETMNVLGFLVWSESHYNEFVDRFNCFRNPYNSSKFEHVSPFELNGLCIDIEFSHGEVALFTVHIIK